MKAVFLSKLKMKPSIQPIEEQKLALQIRLQLFLLLVYEMFFHFMYTKTTKSINITVNPYYLEDQSEPDEHRFVWAYQVTINNLGTERVQLKNRFWKIIDSNGTKQEVKR